MEVIQLPPEGYKLPLNLRLLLLGCSQSGKSTMIAKLLENKSTIFQQPYQKFIFCSPNFGGASLSAAHDLEYKQKLEKWAAPADIQFFNYILSEAELMDISNSMPGSRLLFIVDDFSLELMQTALVYKLFTSLSSHKSIDSCVSIHNNTTTAASGKWFQAVKDNYNCLIIFPNIANRDSISQVSKRIYPHCNNFLSRCLSRASEIMGNYAHICIDASMANPLNRRFGVRCNIFNEHGLPTILFKNPKIFYSGR